MWEVEGGLGPHGAAYVCLVWAMRGLAWAAPVSGASAMAEEVVEGKPGLLKCPLTTCVPALM